MAVIVRKLIETDAQAFRILRLSALQSQPDAFVSAWEEEVDRPLSWFADILRDEYVVGAQIDGILIGTAALHRGDRLKTRHRATLWSMYVVPTARHRGVGATLVREVIGEARGTVEELHLSVGANNDAALKLYETLGFVRFGLDTRALKISNQYVDVVMMRLAL